MCFLYLNLTVNLHLGGGQFYRMVKFYYCRSLHYNIMRRKPQESMSKHVRDSRNGENS